EPSRGGGGAGGVGDAGGPPPPLVLGPRDPPRPPRRVGRGEQRVTCTRVVVPAAVRLQVHRRQLPDLAAVVNARLEPTRLLLRAHFEPILDQEDARVDHRLLDARCGGEKSLRPLLGGEATYATRP